MSIEGRNIFPAHLGVLAKTTGHAIDRRCPDSVCRNRRAYGKTEWKKARGEAQPIAATGFYILTLLGAQPPPSLQKKQ